MKERMYKKITSLYKEGITAGVITKMLIDLSKHSTEAAEKVERFFNEEVMKDSEATTLLLRAVQTGQLQEYATLLAHIDRFVKGE